MFDYFRMYYLELAYGPGFVLTEIFFAAGAVLIFERVRPERKSVLHILWQIPAVWLISVMLSSLNQMLLGGESRNIFATAALILLYALLSRTYPLRLRLVRGSVYYACYQQALAISEASGTWIRERFGEKRYGIMDNSTWMLILLILMLAVILINYWAVEDTLFLPASFSTLIIMASVLGVVLQYGANAMAIERGYEVIVAGTFLFLEMFSYYLLYALSNRTRENMELAAIEQQQHLDEELLQSFHDNLESMHMIRHEIRNHMAYIRVLVAQEEYDKLFDYTNSVLGEAEVLFTTVSSGNDVVDAVVNHGIQKAQKAGITVRASVVAPPVLPFAEKDFCSILSNLMDNALEAASASGKPDPVLEVSIRPQQDYLFIRVTNPVSEEVSRRGLSLRTTKKEAALHGYGTRIVRYLTERYHGSVQYELKDGIFIADVMLDLNAGPEADSARRTASL